MKKSIISRMKSKTNTLAAGVLAIILGMFPGKADGQAYDVRVMPQQYYDYAAGTLWLGASGVVNQNPTSRPPGFYFADQVADANYLRMVWNSSGTVRVSTYPGEAGNWANPNRRPTLGGHSYLPSDANSSNGRRSTFASTLTYQNYTTTTDSGGVILVTNGSYGIYGERTNNVIDYWRINDAGNGYVVERTSGWDSYIGFDNNSAINGGAIMVTNGTLDLLRTNFGSNKATGQFGLGGAIMNDQGGTINLNLAHFGTYTNQSVFYLNYDYTAYQTAYDATYWPLYTPAYNAVYNPADYNPGGSVYMRFDQGGSSDVYTPAYDAAYDKVLADNLARPIPLPVAEATLAAEAAGRLAGVAARDTAVAGARAVAQNAAISAGDAAGRAQAEQAGNLAAAASVAPALAAAQRNGNTAWRGGAIHNAGKLNTGGDQSNAGGLWGSSFTENKATQYGGAIFNEHTGVINILGVFNANTAGVSGGAIYNVGRTTLTSGSRLQDNTVTDPDGLGGGIFNDQGATVNLNGTYLARNIAGQVGVGAAATYAGLGGGTYNKGVLNLNSVTYEQNKARRGGAIFNLGDITSTGSSAFAANFAEDSGGAIYFEGGESQFDDASFTSNRARVQGGAIYNKTAKLNLGTANFQGNGVIDQVLDIRTVDGGAIYNYFGTMTINSGSFTDNKAARYGGAIVVETDGSMTILDGTFTRNEAGQDGGAIYTNRGATLVLSDIIATENKVPATAAIKGLGGFIYNGLNGDVTITSNRKTNEFTKSEAYEGGVVYNDTDAKISITKAKFDHNNATNFGGVVYNKARGTLTITDGFFTTNTALSGGGIYNEAGDRNNGKATLNNVEFLTNTATAGSGGAVYNKKDGVIVIETGTFTENTATVSGGAIYNDVATYDAQGKLVQKEGVISIKNGTFKKNSSIEGGAVANHGVLSIDGTNFADNEALGGYGGAIYNAKNTYDVTGTLIVQPGGSLTVKDVLFSQNIAVRGGAVYNAQTGSNLDKTDIVQFTGGQFDRNRATGTGGGAVYNDLDGKMTFTGTTFTWNDASRGSGVYNNTGGVLTLTDVSFTDNNARVTDIDGNQLGGAIYNNGALAGVTETTINLNVVAKDSLFGRFVGASDNIYFTGLNNKLNVDVANTDFSLTMRGGGMSSAANAQVDITKTGVGKWILEGKGKFGNNAIVNFDLQEGTLAMKAEAILDLGNIGLLTTHAGTSIDTGTAIFALTPGADNTPLVINEARLSTNQLVVEGHTEIVAAAFDFKAGSIINFEDLTLKAVNKEGPYVTLTLSDTVDADPVTVGSDIYVSTPQNVDLKNGGYIVLFDTNGYFNGTSGTLFLDGTAVPKFERSEVPGTQDIGLAVTNNNQWIVLTMVDTSAKSVDLSWTGLMGDAVWKHNVDTEKNWSGTVAGHYVDFFMNNDEVFFADDYYDVNGKKQTVLAANKTVEVDADGVIVGAMTVTGAGYVFDLTDAAAAGVIGINAVGDGTTTTGDIDFGAATVKGVFGNGIITASRDIKFNGGVVTFDGAATIDAGRDFVIGTADFRNVEGELNAGGNITAVDGDFVFSANGAAINAGGTMNFGEANLNGIVDGVNGPAITAGEDFMIDGGGVTYKGAATIDAGRDIIIGKAAFRDVEGQIIAGRNMTVVNGDFNFKAGGVATIDAAGDIDFGQARLNGISGVGAVHADGSINFVDGTVRFNGPATIDAGRSITIGTADFQAVEGEITALEDVIVGDGDFNFKAGGTAKIEAGRDIKFGQANLNGISGVDAVVAGQDITFDGGLVQYNGPATIKAARDIYFNTANVKGIEGVGAIQAEGNINATDGNFVFSAAGGTIVAEGDINFGQANLKGIAGNGVVNSLSGDITFTNGTLEYAGASSMDAWENIDFGNATFGSKTGGIVQNTLATAGGSINVNGGNAFHFALAGVGDGDTMMTLDAATGVKGKIGDGTINIWDVNLAVGDKVILVDAGSSMIVTNTGTLYDQGKEVKFKRDLNSAKEVLGLLVQDENGDDVPFGYGSQLVLTMVKENSVSSDLTWTGVIDGTWNINKAPNWIGTVGGHYVDTFLNGDTVLFADKYFNPKSVNPDHLDDVGAKNVNVVAGGVEVNGMTVTGAGYSFDLSKGGIIATNADDPSTSNIDFGTASIINNTVGRVVDAGGTITFAGANTLTFDLNLAKIGETMLTLNTKNGANGGVVGIVGNGNVYVSRIPTLNTGDSIILVDTKTAGSVVAGLLYKDGSAVAEKFERDADPNKKILNLSAEANASQLVLTTLNTNTVCTDLRWSGADTDGGGVWIHNVLTEENWAGYVDKYYVKSFLNGDTVTFGETYDDENGNSQDVVLKDVVTGGAVSVKNMTVDGEDYTFDLTKGGITAVGDFDPITGDLDPTTGNIDFKESVTVTGLQDIGGVKAMKADGNISFVGGSIDYAGAATIEAGENVAFGATALNNLAGAITATTGDVDFTGAAITYGGVTTITAGQDVNYGTANVTGINGAITAGNDINVVDGSLGFATAAAITAGQNIDFGTAALNNLSGAVTATAGDVTANGTLTYGGAAAIKAGQNVDFGGATLTNMAGSITATAGDVNFVGATITYGGTTTITAGQDINYGTANITGIDGAITAGNDINVVDGSLGFATPAAITAGQNVDFGTANLSGLSGNITATAGDVSVNGTIAFSGVTTVNAGGDINLANTTFGTQTGRIAKGTTFNAGGTTTVAGGNAFTFELNNVTNGQTVLAMNNVTGTVGDGVINVWNATLGNNDSVILIDTGTGGAAVATGDLYSNGVKVDYVRDADASNKILALTTNKGVDSQLILTKISTNAISTDLAWSGLTSSMWVSDVKAEKNWAGHVENYFVDTFLNGDTVTFGATYTDASGAVQNVGNFKVTVAPAGVEVAGMTVTDTRYSFDLNVTTTPVILATGDIHLGNSKLNISGYAGGDFDGEPLAVITAGTSLDGFNKLVTIAGQDQGVDFMSAIAYQGGDRPGGARDDGKGADTNTIYVETQLTWYSTSPERPAHGDFTVDSDFTLGSQLNDNTNPKSTWRTGWDGKTLTKKGNSILTLTAANTYTGDTNINAGTLRITDADGAGDHLAASKKVIIAKDATFDLGFKAANGDPCGNVATDYSQKITGDGKLVKSETGLIVLTGDNTYTGGTVIEKGGIIIDKANAVGTGDVNIAKDGTFTIGVSGKYGEDIEISGAGKVYINPNRAGAVGGDNTTILVGNNTYTGETIVCADKTVELQSITGTGVNDAGTIVSLRNGANLNFGSAAETLLGDVEYKKTIRGVNVDGTANPANGTVNKFGDNTLTLSAANSYGEGTNINAGRLIAANIAAVGTGDVTNAAEFEIAAGGIFNNKITGAGDVFINPGVNETTTLTNATSDYTGKTTVETGTAKLTHENATGDNQASRHVELKDNTKLELAFNADGTYSKTIDGTGKVVKSGATTVTLDTSNTYEGGTDVNAGTLVAKEINAVGTGTVNIAKQGTFKIAAGSDKANQDNPNSPNGGNFDNLITGSGELVVDPGNGKITTLSQDNKGFTGNTTIDSGTARITNINGVGLATSKNTTVTLANGTTFEFDVDSPNSATFSKEIIGAGSVVKNNVGTVILDRDSKNYTGTTTINDGRLTAKSIDALGTGVVANNSELEIAAAGDFDNVINGTGSVTVNPGAGKTTTLSQVNTYTGNTIVEHGIAKLTNKDSAGPNVAKVGNVEQIVDLKNTDAFVEIAFGGKGTDAYPCNPNPITGADFNQKIIGNGGVRINAGQDSFVVLTNENTYTGKTELVTGSLIVDNAKALGGSSTIDIADSKSNFTIGAAGTFSQAITGKGNVYINPARDKTDLSMTTTLTGNSSYEGNTTVCIGTTVLKHINATGLNEEGKNVFLRGGTFLEFNIGSDQTYYKSIVEDDTDLDPKTVGTVVKSGNSKLTLAAKNTYEGGTDINGGTLVAHHVDSKTKLYDALGSKDVRNFGKLVLDLPGNFANVVSGDGQLEVASGSTANVVELSGNSTYTGKTTVTSGTAKLTNINGTGFNDGSTKVDLVNSGSVLDIAVAGKATDKETYNKTITGNGTLVKSTEAELTLTGLNTHQKTELQKGTTIITNAKALGQGTTKMFEGTTLGFNGGDMTPTTKFDLDGSVKMDTMNNSNVTIDKAITGGTTSHLTKVNDGTLTLTQANTFNGLTVDGGRVTAMSQEALGKGAIVNNSELEVNFAAGVNEYIRRDITTSAGTFIKSGDGRMNVDYTLATKSFEMATGTLGVKLGKGLVSATNGFAIAKGTQLVGIYEGSAGLGRGSQNATSFEVLKGVGADGGFAVADRLFESALDHVEWSTHVESNSLFYDLWVKSYYESYEQYLSDNAKNAANAVDHLPTNDPLFQAIGDLKTTQEVVQAFSELHGEVYETEIFAQTDMQRQFNDILLRRKIYCEHVREFKDFRAQSGKRPMDIARGNREMWVEFTGGGNFRSSIGQYSAYDMGRFGVATGFEQRLNRNFFGGLAFGYDQGMLKLASLPSSDRFDAFRMSIYGGYNDNDVSVLTYFGYAKNWHNVERHITFLDATAKSKYNDDVLSAGIEVAKTLHWNSLRFVPTIGMSYVNVQTPYVEETGAGAASLCIDGNNYNSLRVPIGFRLNNDLNIQRVRFTPEFRMFYIAEMAESRINSHTAFATDPTNSFVVDSGVNGKNGFHVGVGLAAEILPRVSLGVDYDGEIWNGYSRHDVGGNVTVRW